MRASTSEILKSRKKSPNLLTKNAHLFNKLVLIFFKTVSSVYFPVCIQDS